MLSSFYYIMYFLMDAHIFQVQNTAADRTSIIISSWDEFVKAREEQLVKVINNSDFASNFKLFTSFFVLEKIYIHNTKTQMFCFNWIICCIQYQRVISMIVKLEMFNCPQRKSSLKYVSNSKQLKEEMTLSVDSLFIQFHFLA